MDAYEATKVVFSRIQSLDPENASKIMGLLLIQDHGEKEMIRLAFGPENLLHSVVLKARQELGISPNTPSNPSTATSPFLSNSNPFSLSRQNSTTTSSRFLPSSLKIPTSISLSTLASPSSSSANFSDFQNLEDLTTGVMNSTNGKSSGLNPWTPPFYKRGGGDLMDELQLQLQHHEQQQYHPQAELGGGAARGASGGGDSISVNGVSPHANWGEDVHCSATMNNLAHRRSCSVSDINLGAGSFLDDPASGLGWKPCLYYAKGFCKNGPTCKFVHDGSAMVGSPSKLEMMEQCHHELLRSKSMQHQKLMAAMASTSPTFPYSMNKGLSLFSQQQQNDSPRSVAAMMMGEELNKFSRTRLENGRGVDTNPASRQIYLTFPADSTFREEDVSNYFSIYGPVQDVRIPYQQKRMFGFVTFVYPETVKIILAKGNPHFVCDARVLVKPYKEKGKVPDKFRKQQQPMERGEFSACNSPTALDSRDPFDLQLGSRMMYDTQYMLWKRKLEEQADLQQAIELQSRRLMGLQLLDVKRNHHHHHHRSLSTGAPIPSPTQSPNSIFHQNLLGSDRSSPDAPDDNCRSPPLDEATDREKEASVGEDNSNNCSVKEGPCPEEDNNLPESLELNLPDSPFASQTRGGAREYMTAFSGGCEAENKASAIPIPGANLTNNNTEGSSFLPASSSLDLPPFNSCYFQMPRFSPGHGAIGM